MTLFALSLPKVANLGTRKISAHDLLQGKVEHVSENSVPQLCGMLPKRVISLWPQAEYLIMNYMARELEEAGREADKTFGGH